MYVSGFISNWICTYSATERGNRDRQKGTGEYKGEPRDLSNGHSAELGGWYNLEWRGCEAENSTVSETEGVGCRLDPKYSVQDSHHVHPAR